jgi:cytochrome c peroxidase
MPYSGFSGPIPSVNLTMVAYPGTVRFRAGKRTAQRYPYAPFFPVLQLNEELQLFGGGNFWDSRATGYLIRNPDAEQAQHPPVDTQEMGLSDTACIAFRLSQAQYRPLFIDACEQSVQVSAYSSDPDSAASALRIGCLRRRATPNYGYPVVHDV